MSYIIIIIIIPCLHSPWHETINQKFELFLVLEKLEDKSINIIFFLKENLSI